MSQKHICARKQALLEKTDMPKVDTTCYTDADSRQESGTEREPGLVWGPRAELASSFTNEMSFLPFAFVCPVVMNCRIEHAKWNERHTKSIFDGQCEYVNEMVLT